LLLSKHIKFIRIQLPKDGLKGKKIQQKDDDGKNEKQKARKTKKSNGSATYAGFYICC
jgi:hypothetical protein